MVNPKLIGRDHAGRFQKGRSANPAGRPKGALMKRSREIAEHSISQGITPLEYLLRILRDETQPQEVRLDAAKAAAPYVHARLAAIASEVKVEFDGLSDSELNEELARAIRELRRLEDDDFVKELLN